METRTLIRSTAVAGAALAGAALFNHWSATQAEAAHPPAGRFVEVDGVRLHYVERGRGVPVVLIHGSASLVEDFVVSGLVERLAERHRVIAFDRPGYGWSERPRGRDWGAEEQVAALVAAAEALGVERPTVVGHSWGTLPALAWALGRPDRIGALVLMAGYYFPTPRPDAVPTAIAGMPLLGDFVSSTILPLQSRLTGPAGFRLIFSPDPTPQRFLDEMPFGLMLRPSQLRATAEDSGRMPATARRLAPRYAELGLPMAIIWGEGDKLVDQHKQSQRLADMLPRAQTVRLPRAGHMVHHVRLDEVMAGIEAVART